MILHLQQSRLRQKETVVPRLTKEMNFYLREGLMRNSKWFGIAIFSVVSVAAWCPAAWGAGACCDSSGFCLESVALCSGAFFPDQTCANITCPEVEAGFACCGVCNRLGCVDTDFFSCLLQGGRPVPLYTCGEITCGACCVILDSTPGTTTTACYQDPALVPGSGTVCDGGLFCRRGLCDDVIGFCEACGPIPPCGEGDGCVSDVDCNDDNPCTDDICSPGSPNCQNLPVPDGSPCIDSGGMAGCCLIGICSAGCSNPEVQAALNDAGIDSADVPQPVLDALEAAASVGQLLTEAPSSDTLNSGDVLVLGSGATAGNIMGDASNTVVLGDNVNVSHDIIDVGQLYVGGDHVTIGGDVQGVDNLLIGGVDVHIQGDVDVTKFKVASGAQVTVDGDVFAEFVDIGANAVVAIGGELELIGNGSLVFEAGATVTLCGQIVCDPGANVVHSGATVNPADHSASCPEW